MCDEKLRTLLRSKRHFDTMQLSYLSKTPNGDGEVSYGPINPTSNSTFTIGAVLVDKFYADHGLTELFPGQNVRALPSSYRAIAEDIQISCAEKKVLAPIREYYDKDENLVYLSARRSVQPIDVNSGSIFEILLNIACNVTATNVAGNYEGINNATYENGGQAEQKITVSFQQTGSDLKVRFKTPTGEQGEGMGTLKGNRVESISLHSTAPECPGSYDGSFSFSDNSVNWSYKGQDCGGLMEGHGTATKVNR